MLYALLYPRMFQMAFNVLKVLCTQGMTTDNKQVPGISFFCRLGEAESAGDDYLPVDDHHLVMGNGVCVIDIHWNFGVFEPL